MIWRTAFLPGNWAAFVAVIHLILPAFTLALPMIGSITA
jgi:ABC-type dipeptide/oligopeptide/nickel transport system permease component